MTRALVLVAAALSLLAPIALAEEMPAEAQQPPFALAGHCAQDAAPPDLAAGVPQPILLNHCTATQENCPSGIPVSCEGHQSCLVGSFWVSCDGVVEECTLCNEPQGCTDPEGYCACKSSGEIGAICRNQYCF